MELNSSQLIGNIENIKSILSEPGYQILSNYFSTYRKIQPCNQNLLSALAVEIFDLSTIYNIKEIIIYMNYFRNIHDSQYSTEDKTSIIDILIRVYMNIISEETLEKKIHSLNMIYLSHLNYLVLLLRECAIYSAITLYNIEKYSEYRKNIPFDVLFLKLYNKSSELNFEDLDMFFYAFSLNVHLINPITFDICEYNPEGKYSIFFLDLPQGYYPLHTLDMYSIIFTSYTQNIHHVIPYKKTFLVSDFEKIEQKCKIEYEKKIKACKDFVFIVNNGLQNVTIDNVGRVLQIEQDLKNVLLGFYCQYCKKIEECYLLSCGHYFCGNEISYIAYGDKLCIICCNDVSKDIDAIYGRN
ncbi:hypothetical protein SteCoe_16324 [Stentor coeruleus]|uniref:Uncharacterized protein n=1 Tax=Stentor coeruleus TaxID=5963 RepID=A0A1R2C1J7_9CILI|nr:hypothetical protein SteCoe_16324 [Stentor coeruleus]